MNITEFFKFVSLIVLLQFFSANIYSQKIALLDTKLKTPIVYTDSVSVSQVSKGFIAIPVTDFDTLYQNLVYLQESLSKRQRSKMQSFQLLTNSTQIDVSRAPMAYGDRYFISLQSKNGVILSRMMISDANISNKKVANKIEEILSYIKSNNSFFTPPKEIHPRFYNIVVISDK